MRKAELIRTPNSVFVNVSPPETTPPTGSDQRVWARVAQAMAQDTRASEPTPEPIPTVEVEKVSTGINPSKVLAAIRERQFEATQRGMAKVKRSRAEDRE